MCSNFKHNIAMTLLIVELTRPLKDYYKSLYRYYLELVSKELNHKKNEVQILKTKRAYRSKVMFYL